jgi:ribosome biogenesis ATPase
MQGLWSTHRRSKLNLNSQSTTPTATPTTEELTQLTGSSDIVNGETYLPKIPGPQTKMLDASASAGAKRKIRPPRAGEETMKRTKLFSGGISKDYAPPTARLSDLGGIEDCIEKMLELVAMPICHPEVYLHTGVQPPRGVLLHGPPGCGKTLLANAMAGVSVVWRLVVFS